MIMSLFTVAAAVRFSHWPRTGRDAVTDSARQAWPGTRRAVTASVAGPGPARAAA